MSATVEDDVKTEFRFSELSETAKATVRDSNRDCDVSYDWWDCTYEDATTIGELIGIEIDTRDATTCGGKTIQVPRISFSGFCSQGDGLCFSGDLYISKLQGCVAKLKGHVGGDEVLEALAARGEAIYDMVTVRLMELRCLGIDPNDKDYEFDELNHQQRVPIKGTERSFRTSVNVEHEWFHSPYEPIRDALNTYVSDFADWIYNQLEAKYDYLTSDEHLDEFLNEDDNLFDEFGSKV